MSSSTTAHTDDDSSWVVKFVPFASTVESSFWVRYCQEKLDTIQLSEQPIDLVGSYGIGSGNRLQIQETSLDSSSIVIPKDRIPIKGKLMGLNTLEAFQQIDKNQLLRDYMNPLGNEESKLTSFVLLTYADLKHHKVLYWFAMPALMPESSIRAVKQESLLEAWSSQECQNLILAVETLRAESSTCPPYFIYFQKKCFPLSAYGELVDSSQEHDDSNAGIVFGFFDPSETTSTTPGTPMAWPLRNLIAHLSLHLSLGGKTVSILSYRPPVLRRNVADDVSSETVMKATLDQVSCCKCKCRKSTIQIPPKWWVGS
jgi:hypothetical protein